MSVATLSRQLAVTSSAIKTLASGALTLSAYTLAKPTVITLKTDNPTGAGAGQHGWTDDTLVRFTVGTVPVDLLTKTFKIKTRTGAPTTFELYDTAGNPVDGTAFAASPGTGAWVVTPYITPGKYTVRISVTGDAIRFMDGGYPTTALGNYLAAGEKIVLKCDPNDLRFIAVSDEAVIYVEYVPYSAGDFASDLQTPTSTGISVTASVEEATGIVVLGYDDTDPQSATKPGMFTRLTNGTAFNSAAAPLNAAVNGINGTGIATLSNPVPVIEGYFTQFARGTFRNVGVQATTIAAIAGTAGMKVFGSSTNTTAAAEKMGHVDMGFIAKRVLIRNNSGKMLAAGWVAGSGTTGGQITNIVMSGSSGTANILVTCAAAHNLPDGTSPVFLAATEAVLTSHGVKAEGYHIATKESATQFSLDLTNVETFTELTGTWGYWYTGFTSYCAPATYVPSTATLAGYTLETSSIPGDVYELPYDIAALFILNPASPAGATADTYGTSYVYFMA